MRIYRGHFTSKDSPEQHTYSLLANDMAQARLILRHRGKEHENLILGKIEDLGEPSTPPPSNRTAEEKLLAAVFGSDKNDYNMPEDYMTFELSPSKGRRQPSSKGRKQ